MKTVPAASTAMVIAIVLAASGCTAKSDGPTAAETEATITREARTAIKVAAQTLGAGETTADAGWYDCVPNMAWSYRGGGTFVAAHGDVAARLAAVRAALIEAGYMDVTKVHGQVAVERGEASFVIGPQRIGTAPARWSFSYQSSCRGYPASDRDRVKADDRHDILAR